MQAFAATQKGPDKDPRNYRKPLDGMWSYAMRECNGGVAPDLAQCYYVGDAAGRPNDHSDSDKGFAAAAGIDFFTPEEFFVRGEGDDDASAAPAPAPVAEEEEEKVGGGGGGASGNAGAPIVLDDDDDDDDETKEFDRSGTP